METAIIAAFIGVLVVMLVFAALAVVTVAFALKRGHDATAMVVRTGRTQNPDEYATMALADGPPQPKAEATAEPGTRGEPPPEDPFTLTSRTGGPLLGG